MRNTLVGIVIALGLLGASMLAAYAVVVVKTGNNPEVQA